MARRVAASASRSSASAAEPGQGGDAEPGEGDGAVFDGVRQGPGIGKAENRGERGLSKVERVEGDRLLAVRAVPGP